MAHVAAQTLTLLAPPPVADVQDPVEDTAAKAAPAVVHVPAVDVKKLRDTALPEAVTCTSCALLPPALQTPAPLAMTGT